MGKVPSKVKFDEDGLPIPQTMQADSVQFDDEGLPIPVKKKEQQPTTVDTLSLFSPTVAEAVKNGGKAGIYKAPLKEAKKSSFQDIEQYNKTFESVTGHKEVDLGSNLPQIKKAKEQSKYLRYRDIEENKIKPLQGSVAMGTVTPTQLSNAYSDPYSKKIVSDIVKEQIPDVDLHGLDKDVFGNEKKWDEISTQINFNNRRNGVDLQNQYLINIDQDIYKKLQNYKLGDIYSGGGTGGGYGGVNIVPFPKIDTNNPTELGEVLSMIQNHQGLIGEDGKTMLPEKDRKELADAISEKLFFLKSQEGVHPEINSVSDKIFEAVSRVNMTREKGEQPVSQITDKENYEQVKLGLNYMKDANPAAYKNIMRGLQERGKISDLDFEELGSIGQKIYNQKMFVEGAVNPEAIGKQTDFDYTSYQTKKMQYSTVLSEELKRMGYTNMSKVPQSAIKEAALKNPELTNWDIIQDIAKDEAAGGYGIVKGGGLNAFFRGVAMPIKGINSTINAVIDSPVDVYLNSRRYDYGDQIIANAKGEVSGELPSERGNMLYDILEGTGQFIPQVLLAKGVGGAISKAYEKSWFGSALTEAQKLNMEAYPGTFVSTFMQTYGDSYADMLQKTGDFSKAKIVGTIDGLSSAGFEMFLPDVKIAEQMKGLWSKQGLAKRITTLVEKGEKEKVYSAVKDFFVNAANFAVKTASIISKEEAEELGTQYADYFTEAMFSPSTVKDRDLANEMFETARQTGLSMIVPAILGAAGDKMQNRKFTKNSLHYLATNFDSFKESLSNGVASGLISEQDYNTIVDAVSQHKKSMSEAPRRDSNGDVISAERQLEYAFQNTVESINRAKAEQLSGDKTQSEYHTKLADKAKEVKDKIFQGEESKTLPPKEEVSLTPEQAVIKQALDNGEITNPTYKSIAEQALENPEIAVQIIDEIKSQANGEVAGQLGNAESTVRNSFGNTLTDYVINVGKEQISHPIELDPNLPEGYQLPEQKRQINDIESKKADIERIRQEELNQQTDAGYSTIALDYLFTGGRDVILSTDYLLQALVGGFTHSAKEINDIRNKYADKLGNIKDDIDSDIYNQMMNEIRGVINKNYNNPKATEIFDKILKNATGFTNREGNQTSIELEKLNEQNESKINAKYDAELDNIWGQQQQETEVNIPELPNPSIEQTETIKQPVTESEEFDATPPPTEPPTNEGEYKFEGKGGREDKGILNRLYNAQNTPEAAKKGFLDEGLKYQTKSQTEAAAVAKSVVDEFGIDESVKMATSMKFDGDVNSLIFAEALNRLSEQESSAKTQDEKLETAKRFAEIGIEYDKMARYGGRFNAAINHFYKKSPLGIVLMENAKRQEDFKDWSKSKEKSWKQGFDELMKDPEFEKVFEEKVGERVKQERKEARKAKKEKVHKAIDETMAKWAKKFSADLPEGTKKAGVSIDIFKAAATTMKAAYDAGEAIGKVIQDAIDYITKETGVTDWDKEGFEKEWAERLTEKGGKVFTDEELKSKVLDKFRKKLNGLTDKQKEEVVRKSFKKIIDNGGLEYDEFKKIIQDVVGRGELTADEQAKLKELVGKTNAVEEAAKKYREERTEEAEKEFRKAEIEAGKATRELNEILWNRPDVVKRLTSIMQLNTLGIPALVNNPIYNMWNQSTLRFPVGVINDAIDRAVSLAAKVFGKKYERDYNVWGTQKEFFKKLGFGSKESVQQLLTGLNRMDYIQKEVYGQQIRPGRAMRDLYAFATGKKNLTKAQIIDKALQATVGIPAEAVARMLNIGDKPQRFAAEGAQAATFAKNLGLKDMDYKLFIEFPREEAYRIYKEQGLSDEEAGKKADYIKDVIVKEGERSTFQQDNLLNKVISAAFGVLGGKDSGYAALAKSLTVSPFIKIPSNAFWSYYNLVNPEVAILQSMVHAGRAKALSGKGDNSSKLAMREARYWFAHAITGMAMRSVVIAMVQAGVFRPANDEDDTKKEREGEGYYEPQGTVNLAKLSAWLRGDDPTKVKGGVLVQNRWFGQWGTVGNSIAKKWQDATPEQREKQDEFWNIVLGGMEVDALKEMGNGVFANTSALLSAIDTNGSFGWSQYGLNTIGLFTNILHPATFAQISRAQLNEATTNRADTFMGQVKNAMLTRSSVLRKLTGQYPETKVGIWGDKIEKQGNVVQRLFGVTPSNKDAFARPIYDDAVRTNDIGYFPPAVQPKIGDTKLTQEQYNKLQEYVGKARRSYVAPFINDQANIVGFNVLYSQLNDEDKKYVLQYLYGLGSEEGKLKLYDDYPELKPKEEDVNYTQEIQRDLFKILQKYQK